MNLDDARVWLYLAAWIPYGLFVALYAFRSPWYRTGLGRSLLLSKTVIFVLITHALIQIAVRPDYPGAWAIRGFLVGGVIVAGWYQLTALVRLQRDTKRHPPRHPKRRSTDL